MVIAPLVEGVDYLKANGASTISHYVQRQHRFGGRRHCRRYVAAPTVAQLTNTVAAKVFVWPATPSHQRLMLTSKNVHGWDRSRHHDHRDQRRLQAPRLQQRGAVMNQGGRKEIPE